MYKLNIGSGFLRYPGYLNIDIDPDCNPDYIVDLERDTLPFPDNSVTDVHIRHILEHLGNGFFWFLQELYRVCCDGAVIKIAVPHHRHDYFLNDPTHKRPITVDGLNLFSKKFNNYCKEINDGCSKLGLYYNVDFEIVNFNYNFNPKYNELVFKARSGDTESQRIMDEIISERNNVIIETEITWIVRKI